MGLTEAGSEGLEVKDALDFRQVVVNPVDHLLLQDPELAPEGQRLIAVG